MRLTTKNNFESMTTEKKSFMLFPDKALTEGDFYFLKLTNDQKQIILRAHKSEMRALLFDLVKALFPKESEQFRGWESLFFEMLVKALKENDD